MAQPSTPPRKARVLYCKYCGDNLLELYDLSKDIGETNDLSAQIPGLAESLHRELIAFLEKANAETEYHRRDHAYSVMLKEKDIDGNGITVERDYISPFEKR